MKKTEPALQAGPTGWTDIHGKWAPSVDEHVAQRFLEKFCEHADAPIREALGVWGLLALTELARQHAVLAMETAFRHGFYFGAQAGTIETYDPMLFDDWRETEPPEDIKRILREMGKRLV